jgi:hypothetical protein
MRWPGKVQPGGEGGSQLASPAGVKARPRGFSSTAGPARPVCGAAALWALARSLGGVMVKRITSRAFPVSMMPLASGHLGAL